MKPICKITLACTVISTVLFVVWLNCFRISSIFYSFTSIDFGKIAGPLIGLTTPFVILILLLVLSSIPVKRFVKNKLPREILASTKRHTKRVIGIIVAGLVFSLAITLLLSIPLMWQISKSSPIIDEFITENSALPLPEYVQNLTVFLNNNLNSSYNRLEALFEIDTQLSHTLLDPAIMDAWNVSRADVILFQGWGSCGQAAILLSQVMHESGYESRVARFKGIDHQWAEVRNETNWLIVDPWYIGNLIDMQFLRDTKPAFQQASGVEVNYFDSAGWVDASKDHGY